MKKTNIGGEDKTNKACFYKCKYDFIYYPIGSCNAINQGNMIQMDYPENKNENIVYNNLKYTPRQIFIYYPSYFNYYDQNIGESKQADAEISIYHTNATSSPLIVNIPIYINTNTTTEASTLITEIITNVSTNAPNKHEKTTIIFNSIFSLTGIIPPKKPFYNFYDNTKSSNCVIFGKENSISISSDSYNKMLTKILSRNDSSSVQDINNGPFIYYNAKGPNANPGDNEIYISCNPTGNSEETKTMVYEKPGILNELSSSNLLNEQTSLFLTNFFKSIYGITLILFVIIIIIIIIYIGFQKYVGNK